MTDNPTEDVPLRRKLEAIWHVAKYDPILVVTIIGLSLFTALLEGVGIGFLLPIVEQLSGGNPDPEGGGRIVEVFEGIYGAFGIQLTVGTLVVGVGLVMGLRYATSFVNAWLQGILGANYVRDLRTTIYDGCLNARVGELDERGSEELLNAVITETTYPQSILLSLSMAIQQVLLCLVYLALALYLAPALTIVAVLVLGGLVVLVRKVIRPAYVTGDRVAEANEAIQRISQAGIQGRRDVRLFTLRGRIRTLFHRATNEHRDASVIFQRNQSLLKNAYLLLSMIVILALIYASVTVASLSIGALAVFLFAMYRLAPRVSSLNDIAYYVEGNLPHLVRLLELTTDLERNTERKTTGESPPSRIDSIAFDDVTFTYDTGEETGVRDLSMTIRRPEFVALVGRSGAGKSTVASLLTRLYEPDNGTIRANGVPIESFDLTGWRSKIAMVQQDPYIFNETLWFNLAVGNPDATNGDLDRACEIAGVTEFFDELPAGYDTELGDDGIRLSGGQKQRVALARAIVKDADVLVLDEATSDVDTSLEADIHRAISEAYADRIIIVIAHRLSTIRDADHIYVMHDGGVVNDGTHRGLLTDDGKYAELVEAAQA